MTLHDEDKHTRIFQGTIGMPREAFVSKILYMGIGYYLLFLNILARKRCPFVFRMLQKLNNCSSFCRKMLTVKG